MGLRECDKVSRCRLRRLGFWRVVRIGARDGMSVEVGSKKINAFTRGAFLTYGGSITQVVCVSRIERKAEFMHK